MKKIILAVLPVLMVTGLLFDTGCKKSDADDPDGQLVGITWVLQTIRYPSRTVTVQRTFTMLFNSDGSLDMVVDCNVCGGSYTTGDNNALSFPGAFACTEADCGPDSEDTEFHEALDSVSRYEVDGNVMRLYFNNQVSSLDFVAQ